MRGKAAAILSAVTGFAVAASIACVKRPRMCSAASECFAGSQCVAGRCQLTSDGGWIPQISEQSDAGAIVRRVVVSPVDVAWMKPGDGTNEASAMPAIFPLGRRADGNAVLFVRFAVPLARETQVVEAYLLLARSESMDADPTPISLHACRIAERWDSRSLSWATQPRIEDLGLATSRVDGQSPTLVRLDVRRLVAKWAEHDSRDQGIAVVAEGESATGVPFAYQPSSTQRGVQPQAPGITGVVERAERASAAPEGATVELLSPRLELYLK
jgi:hypothetical protein